MIEEVAFSLGHQSDNCQNPEFIRDIQTQLTQFFNRIVGIRQALRPERRFICQQFAVLIQLHSGISIKTVLRSRPRIVLEFDPFHSGETSRINGLRQCSPSQNDIVKQLGPEQFPVRLNLRFVNY